jgi:hypothetical protein
LQYSMLSSIDNEKSLVSNDIIIVPVEIIKTENTFTVASPSFSSLLPGFDENEAQSLLHIALPMLIREWEETVRSELMSALTQIPDALDKGITIIIKKNGKVGSRRFGVPVWEQITDDVEARTTAGLDITNI